jgi:hypothetical protein
VDGAARVLRLVGVGIMAVFGLLATAFVVGSAMQDPGGAAGAALAGAFLVPLAVLVGVALAWPRVGTWVLGVATLGVVGLYAWFALDSEWWREVMDDRGPIVAVAGIAVAVSLGALGVHRARVAGALLVAFGALCYLVPLALSRSGGAEAAGGGPSLMVSAGIVVVPSVLAGLLLLLSAWLSGRAAGASTQPSTRGDDRLAVS